MQLLKVFFGGAFLVFAWGFWSFLKLYKIDRKKVFKDLIKLVSHELSEIENPRPLKNFPDNFPSNFQTFFPRKSLDKFPINNQNRIRVIFLKCPQDYNCQYWKTQQIDFIHETIFMFN
jgi:hypothetical protein